MAEKVRVMVEELAPPAISRFAVREEVARWLAWLDDVLRDRLAAARLIEQQEAALLGKFIDAHVADRNDVKPRTRIMLGQAKRSLVEFFGPKKRLKDITPGDADDWLQSVIGDGPVLNTYRKRRSMAKLFFKAAIRKRLLEENPFRDLKGSLRPNPERLRYISAENIRDAKAMAPDAEWRVIIALARFAGLGTPSETMALRWENIDWARNRMLVRSPKTEQHAGKEFRLVPLFPVILEALADAFEAARPGAAFVAEKYRRGCQNLRTHMLRMIRRAGPKP